MVVDVGYSPATKAVLEALRQQILSGELRGGVTLREEELASKLGVSRTPVREAIAALLGEGLLTKGRNRGVQVFQPSLQDLVEIYEIREPLEVLAARLVTEEAAPEALTAITAAWKDLKDGKPGYDWSVKHEAFHLAFAQGAGRPRLNAIIRSLRAQSEPYIRLAVQVDPVLFETARAQHEQMVIKVQQRDAKGVSRLVSQHLQTTLRHLPTLAP